MSAFLSHRRSHHRGIALVLVLWVLALLTVIAVGLTTAQRTESVLTRNQLAAARFRAAAEAGIAWTALHLLAPPSAFEDQADAAWIPDGAPRPFAFGDETLEIRIDNEYSRIDLNKAPKDLLAALVLAAGAQQETADALADAIEDWRDTNDLAELNGAEDGDYADAGLSYGAKDGPFDSVEELQLVLGMDRALYRLLAPALTVDADRNRVAQEYAPPLVQAALRGITLEEVEQEQDEQEDADDATDAPRIDRGGPLYRIRIARVVAGTPGLGMEALVRIQETRRPPVEVVWRRYGVMVEPAMATGEASGVPTGRGEE